MRDIYFIVVVYNKLISDIASLNVFLEFSAVHDNVGIIIMDNSDFTKSEANRFECESKYSNKLIYINNYGNIGLSRAYNKAIDYIDQQTQKYTIMLADDDTVFSLAYLNNALTELHKGALIISGIFDQLSPLKHNRILHHRNDIITEPGCYEDIFCINSGLWIDSSIIKRIGRFDESLFLDLVDYWLMDKLISVECNKISVVSGKISQHFSGQETVDKAKANSRFQIYKRDFIQYCRLTNKPWLYRFLIILKRRVRLFFI